MKKSILALAMVVLMAHTALAWEFSAFGYKVAYNPVVVEDFVSNAPTSQNNAQISTNMAQEVQTPYQSQTSVESPPFQEEMNELNALPEVSLILKELDYRRIGFMNLDDGQFYTIYVDEWGKITNVKKGNYDVETTIQASVSRVRTHAIEGDAQGVKDSVVLPFQVKMKLLMLKIF